MLVVLDTNILLSAMISPHGHPDLIYRAWRTAKFTLVTCSAQLEELRRASRYPKFTEILQPARVGAMINNLQGAVILKKLITSEKIVSEDPNDAFLIDLSLTGKADYLITGDHKSGLLKLKNIDRTRVLTPVEFCKEIL